MTVQMPYELEVQLRKTPVQTGFERAVFVVAYNDLHAFTSYFASSPFIQRKKTVSVYNLKNEGLPTIFNRIVKEHSTEDTWLIFCHQDFILKEDLLTRLKELDVNTIYGPIGVRRGDNRFFGQIVQTDNSLIGCFLTEPTLVQTLDEMCIIAHSSAFEKGMAFDERFRFHFYGADLCLKAYSQGFGVNALQVDCQHMSKTLGGNTQSEDFKSSRELFAKKWSPFLPIRTTSTLLLPEEIS
jgi:GT2 family glycosyltransferase